MTRVTGKDKRADINRQNAQINRQNARINRQNETLVVTIASNMMGHKTGEAKRIQDLQPKAYPTRCHGHSLSVSVKDTTKNCELLLDTMGTAKEIISLMKFSPKRENLLGK